MTYRDIAVAGVIALLSVLTPTVVAWSIVATYSIVQVARIVHIAVDARRRCRLIDDLAAKYLAGHARPS